MQKSEDNQTATSIRRQVKQSTTLNRKYVKRPSKQTDGVVTVRRSPQVSRFATQTTKTQQAENTKVEKIEGFTKHPLQSIANARVKARQDVSATQSRKLTAKEIKDQAIKKALQDAEKQNAPIAEKIQDQPEKTKGKIRFGLGRVVLALTCAAAAVFAIVYFVSLNMPDISFRVAAMQTGIDASYPSHVPRNYNLSGITSENDKIILSFINTVEDTKFDIIEEKSHWDTNALLASYVKPTYGENYTVVRERGLTIYISESNATWVNGGIFYKIEASSGTLTKKQICSVATSL